MHAAWVFLVEFGFKVHRGLVAERHVSGMFAVPLTPILLTMRSWQTSECSGLILWRGPLVAAPPRCVHLRLNCSRVSCVSRFMATFSN